MNKLLVVIVFALVLSGCEYKEYRWPRSGPIFVSNSGFLHVEGPGWKFVAILTSSDSLNGEYAAIVEDSDGVDLWAGRITANEILDIISRYADERLNKTGKDSSAIFGPIKEARRE